MTISDLKENLGILKIAAFSHQAEFLALKYQCGDGNKDLIEHFDCIQSIGPKYKKELQICHNIHGDLCFEDLECSHCKKF
ncbi:hypothetical protein L596_021761 [Steinernema carpocapsae]|uniref:Uncharacterized protein n=1 Tax=Steinernema carpocapsae TaxID=34508 RepID=A0A4U5MK18_STECR|nr:hypothetical protein L596_021761 [Steinernema carpocapsae]